MLKILLFALQTRLCIAVWQWSSDHDKRLEAALKELKSAASSSSSAASFTSPFRNDGRCGVGWTGRHGETEAPCDPSGPHPCCSVEGFCVASATLACEAPGAIDFRSLMPSWTATGEPCIDGSRCVVAESNTTKGPTKGKFYCKTKKGWGYCCAPGSSPLLGCFPSTEKTQREGINGKCRTSYVDVSKRLVKCRLEIHDEKEADICGFSTPSAYTPDPCVNGGRCAGISHGGWKCICPRGFTGRFCHLNVSNCQESGCENGGTCVPKSLRKAGELRRTFRCQCSQGFYGLLCEKKDKCFFAELECGEHGRCENNACTCDEGWQGETCSQPTASCDPTPCRRGSRCVDEGVGKFRCECGRNFEGVRCDRLKKVLKIGDSYHMPNGSSTTDACLFDPCFNGGTCSMRGATFGCICLPKYTGFYCEDPLDTRHSVEDDPCSIVNNRCKNRGRCRRKKPEEVVRAGNGVKWACDCLKGWEGDRCELHPWRCHLSGGASCWPMNSWREDKRCGVGFVAPNGVNPSECDPESTHPCCNFLLRKCGKTPQFCDCGEDCVDFRRHQGTRTVSGKRCRKGERCRHAGYHYFWCFVDDSNWEYCCNPSQGCSSSLRDGVTPYPGYTSVLHVPPHHCLVFVYDYHMYGDHLAKRNLQNCLVGPSPCLSNPCKNGGKCVDVGQRSFRCLCPRGRAKGRFCETHVTECACENAGTCDVDNQGVPVCRCLHGYAGARCQRLVGGAANPCRVSRCQNGATCYLSSTDDELGACLCPPGFAGETCEEILDEDLDLKHLKDALVGEAFREDFKCGKEDVAPNGANPPICDPNGPRPCCDPKGICVAKTAEFNCTCKGCIDYPPSRLTAKGDRCWMPNLGFNVTESDRLHLLRSAGSGTAEYDGVDAFEQQVNHDFAALDRFFNGNEIEVDLPWEAENVCNRHAAEGRVSKGSETDYYWCWTYPYYNLHAGSWDYCCAPGHSCGRHGFGYDWCYVDNVGGTWQYCNPVTPCESQPCHHGGTCHERGQHYVCSCRPGTRGSNCETQLDECPDGHWCLNGGSCRRRVENGDYKGWGCTCPPTFHGPKCGVPRGVCLRAAAAASAAAAEAFCLNGGRCVLRFEPSLRREVKRCVCGVKFEGSRCQHRKNLKNDNPWAPFRRDGRCGPEWAKSVAFGAAFCDAGGVDPCCGPDGRCSGREDSCFCATCLDYRNLASRVDALGNACLPPLDACGAHDFPKDDRFFCTVAAQASPNTTQLFADTRKSFCCAPGSDCGLKEKEKNRKRAKLTCRSDFSAAHRVPCRPLESICDAANPCVVGRCVRLPGSGVASGFVCVCPEGRMGRHCEVDDPCKSHPCLHGGVCSHFSSDDGSLRFRCRCVGDWEGGECQFCKVGATCLKKEEKKRKEIEGGRKNEKKRTEEKGGNGRKIKNKKRNKRKEIAALEDRKLAMEGTEIEIENEAEQMNSDRGRLAAGNAGNKKIPSNRPWEVNPSLMVNVDAAQNRKGPETSDAVEVFWNREKILILIGVVLMLVAGCGVAYRKKKKTKGKEDEEEDEEEDEKRKTTTTTDLDEDMDLVVVSQNDNYSKVADSRKKIKPPENFFLLFRNQNNDNVTEDENNNSNYGTRNNSDIDSEDDSEYNSDEDSEDNSGVDDDKSDESTSDSSRSDVGSEDDEDDDDDDDDDDYSSGDRSSDDEDDDRSKSGNRRVKSGRGDDGGDAVARDWLGGREVCQGCVVGDESVGSGWRKRRGGDREVGEKYRERGDGDRKDVYGLEREKRKVGSTPLIQSYIQTTRNSTKFRSGAGRTFGGAASFPEELREDERERERQRRSKRERESSRR